MKTPFTFRSPWFLFVSTLALAGSAIGAQPLDAKPIPLSDSMLEIAFWDCDVLSAREALPLSVGAQCSVLFEEFKQRRFGGDFAALLDWWQQHKAAEHAARSAGVGCDGVCDAALETP